MLKNVFHLRRPTQVGDHLAAESLLELRVISECGANEPLLVGPEDRSLSIIDLDPCDARDQRDLFVQLLKPGRDVMEI